MGGIKFSEGGSFLEQIHPTTWVIPQELPQKVKKKKKILRIGVPADGGMQERRVPLTPEAVAVIIANGHEVYVETSAGKLSSFSDNDYSEAGALICYSHTEIFQKADILVKISPVNEEEQDLLKSNQTVLSAVNLGRMDTNYLKTLIKKNITGIGFEFLQSRDGRLPIVQMMSEIAGVSSIHIASELLCGTNNGKGLLLGGITGVPPAEITIIGAGTVGYHAAKTAMSMGATVKIIDEEVFKLRRFEKELGINIYTAVSLQKYVKEAVQSSDVVIGAAFRKGQRAPMLVTEDMVCSMKEGSVIVDVAIDQGGCIETSRVTTHDKPTFNHEGIIHYCVPNIASRVSQTASQAISNILGPLIVRAGDMGGIDGLLKHDEGIKQGVYVYKKHLTKRYLSKLFNIDFVNINLLVASGL